MKKEYKVIIIFLICFIFNAYLKAQNTDIDWLRQINTKRNPKLDLSYKIVTHSVIPIGIGTPASMFAVGLINHDNITRNNGIELGASFALASCLSTGLKIGINRPRPYVTYPEIEHVVMTGPYSFPSGHTSAAFATATSLSLMYPKWYVIAPSFTWACLAGYSRMHLGVHYPSDVFFGVVIGVGSALLVHQGAKWMQKK